MSQATLRDLAGKCEVVKAQMVAAGWDNVAGMMHQDDDLQFGSLMVKDGREFWLNIFTMDEVPTSG